jgi:hypothetical protein
MHAWSRTLGDTRFRVDSEHCLVVSIGEGVLTAGDMIDAARRQASDDDFRPGMHFLWDLRGARFIVDHLEIEELAEVLSGLPLREKPHKTAIVTLDRGTRSLVSFLPRAGPEHSVEYQTFEVPEDALTWLGLPQNIDLAV